MAFYVIDANGTIVDESDNRDEAFRIQTSWQNRTLRPYQVLPARMDNEYNAAILRLRAKLAKLDTLA